MKPNPRLRTVLGLREVGGVGKRGAGLELGLALPLPLEARAGETHGIAGTATEEAIRDWTLRLATATGIDAAPEGGCALSVLRDAVTAGTLSADAEVVVFNTGSGASYRA